MVNILHDILDVNDNNVEAYDEPTLKPINSKQVDEFKKVKL
jgi:hypothetical protein